MKPSYSSRTKRHTTFLVLLGWLFALVSGVANACLLEARATHIHPAPAEWSDAAKASPVSPGHVGVVAGHDDDPDAASALCLKACDEGARSLPKQKLPATQAYLGPAPLVSILWTAVAPVATSLWRFDGTQPALPELPIRVRYSRLAL